MRAIICKKINKKWHLVYQEIQKPTLKDDEILINVKAVSLNAADYRSMSMGMIPKRKIFGADIAGIVEQVGIKCKIFKIGDEVFGDLSSSGFGGLAEYAIAKEDAFIIKSEDISFDVAASIPMAGITALQGIRDAGKIKSNLKVLIYGSGGGVGTFAVQLAHYYHAHVTTVSGSSNVDLMRSLHADHVIDYQKDDIKEKLGTYDLILAINGHQKLKAYKNMLNKHGRLVVIGGSISQILKTLLFGKFLSIGHKKVILLKSNVNHKDLSFLAELVQNKHIIPVIDKKVRLEEVPIAFLELSKGHSKGKVIVNN
jgi:NADPH:quinone reductase-like Zn-dependent oxidoreductase